MWEHVGVALYSVLGIRPRAQDMRLRDPFGVSRIPSASENSWRMNAEGAITSAPWFDCSLPLGTSFILGVRTAGLE